ncbi:MAG: radical SAM protein [Candidatus Wallbacteria bacterium]|nr:radical SAM protein [Candidatus Wallbacteria bacterium]
MKIVFLSYSGYPQHSDNFIPNPGPAILATLCRNHGHSAKVLDLNRPEIFSQCPDEHSLTDYLIAEFEQDLPDVLGITTWFNAYQDTAVILQKLRRRFPALFVVGGGYHATWFEEDFLRTLPEITGNDKPVFDMLLLGEGEKPMLELLEHLAGRRKKKEIAGALYVEGGSIRRGAPQIFHDLTDESVSPLPDWSLYGQKEGMWPILMLDLSRGCFNRCIMCGHEAMSGHGIRPRNIRKVVDSMKSDHQKFGVSHFRVTSSMLSLELIESFTSEILTRTDFPALTWSCFSEAHELKGRQDLLERMKLAGCLAIFFGLESADNRVLGRLNKRNTREDLEEVILGTKKAGIKAIASIMVGNPGESEESLKSTVDFILRVRPDSVPSVPIAPFPRTELTAHPERHGYVLNPLWKKAMMTMRVEHIQDPDKWTYPADFYKHSSGKSFLDYSKICGDISRKLYDHGISRVSDEVYLMADLLKKDPNTVYLEHSTKLKERDMNFFSREIQKCREKSDEI